MQCFAPPANVPPPEYDYSDPNPDSFHKIDKAYTADLKAALIANGDTGPLTGEIVRFPIADGYAQYMVFDAPGRRPAFGLIHMPLGDAYQIPEAHLRGLRKQDIQNEISRSKRLQALFAKGR